MYNRKDAGNRLFCETTSGPEHVLIAGVLRILSVTLVARRQTQPQEASMPTLPKIFYIASALRARPRAIDRYIDYFGDSVPIPANTSVASPKPETLPPRR